MSSSVQSKKQLEVRELIASNSPLPCIIAPGFSFRIPELIREFGERIGIAGSVAAILLQPNGTIGIVVENTTAKLRTLQNQFTDALIGADEFVPSTRKPKRVEKPEPNRPHPSKPAPALITIPLRDESTLTFEILRATPAQEDGTIDLTEMTLHNIHLLLGNLENNRNIPYTTRKLRELSKQMADQKLDQAIFRLLDGKRDNDSLILKSDILLRMGKLGSKTLLAFFKESAGQRELADIQLALLNAYTPKKDEQSSFFKTILPFLQTLEPANCSGFMVKFAVFEKKGNLEIDNTLLTALEKSPDDALFKALTTHFLTLEDRMVHKEVTILLRVARRLPANDIGDELAKLLSLVATIVKPRETHQTPAKVGKTVQQPRKSLLPPKPEYLALIETLSPFWGKLYPATLNAETILLLINHLLENSELEKETTQAFLRSHFLSMGASIKDEELYYTTLFLLHSKNLLNPDLDFPLIKKSAGALANTEKNQKIHINLRKKTVDLLESMQGYSNLNIEIYSAFSLLKFNIELVYTLQKEGAAINKGISDTLDILVKNIADNRLTFNDLRAMTRGFLALLLTKNSSCSITDFLPITQKLFAAINSAELNLNDQAELKWDIVYVANQWKILGLPSVFYKTQGDLRRCSFEMVKEAYAFTGTLFQLLFKEPEESSVKTYFVQSNYSGLFSNQFILFFSFLTAFSEIECKLKKEIKGDTHPATKILIDVINSAFELRELFHRTSGKEATPPQFFELLEIDCTRNGFGAGVSPHHTPPGIILIDIIPFQEFLLNIDPSLQAILDREINGEFIDRILKLQQLALLLQKQTEVRANLSLIFDHPKLRGMNNRAVFKRALDGLTRKHFTGENSDNELATIKALIMASPELIGPLIIYTSKVTQCKPLVDIMETIAPETIPFSLQNLGALIKIGAKTDLILFGRRALQTFILLDPILLTHINNPAKRDEVLSIYLCLPELLNKNLQIFSEANIDWTPHLLFFLEHSGDKKKVDSLTTIARTLREKGLPKDQTSLIEQVTFLQNALETAAMTIEEGVEWFHVILVNTRAASEKEEGLSEKDRTQLLRQMLAFIGLLRKKLLGTFTAYYQNVAPSAANKMQDLYGKCLLIQTKLLIQQCRIEAGSNKTPLIFVENALASMILDHVKMGFVAENYIKPLFASWITFISEEFTDPALMSAAYKNLRDVTTNKPHIRHTLYTALLFQAINAYKRAKDSSLFNFTAAIFSVGLLNENGKEDSYDNIPLAGADKSTLSFMLLDLLDNAPSFKDKDDILIKNWLDLFFSSLSIWTALDEASIPTFGDSANCRNYSHALIGLQPDGLKPLDPERSALAPLRYTQRTKPDQEILINLFKRLEEVLPRIEETPSLHVAAERLLDALRDRELTERLTLLPDHLPCLLVFFELLPKLIALKLPAASETGKKKLPIAGLLEHRSLSQKLESLYDTLEKKTAQKEQTLSFLRANPFPLTPELKNTELQCKILALLAENGWMDPEKELQAIQTVTRNVAAQIKQRKGANLSLMLLPILTEIVTKNEDAQITSALYLTLFHLQCALTFSEFLDDKPKMDAFDRLFVDLIDMMNKPQLNLLDIRAMIRGFLAVLIDSPKNDLESVQGIITLLFETIDGMQIEIGDQAILKWDIVYFINAFKIGKLSEVASMQTAFKTLFFAKNLLTTSQFTTELFNELYSSQDVAITEAFTSSPLPALFADATGPLYLYYSLLAALELSKPNQNPATPESHANCEIILNILLQTFSLRQHYHKTTQDDPLPLSALMGINEERTNFLPEARFHHLPRNLPVQSMTFSTFLTHANNFLTQLKTYPLCPEFTAKLLALETLAHSLDSSRPIRHLIPSLFLTRD